MLVFFYIEHESVLITFLSTIKEQTVFLCGKEERNTPSFSIEHCQVHFDAGNTKAI